MKKMKEISYVIMNHECHIVPGKVQVTVPSTLSRGNALTQRSYITRNAGNVREDSEIGENLMKNYAFSPMTGSLNHS